MAANLKRAALEPVVKLSLVAMLLAAAAALAPMSARAQDGIMTDAFDPAMEAAREKAHAELKAYAHNLEKMVEDRTKEIRAKSEVMKRELELAIEVQHAMLPATDSIQTMAIASLYRPCHEVSGDLYDYAELPDGRIFIFIADISGHGVPSALVGAMCKMSLGSQDFSRTNAGDILKKLSEEMKKVTTSHYLTGIFMLIDPQKRTIEYANGGHVPCLLQSAKSSFLPMEATGRITSVTMARLWLRKRTAGTARIQPASAPNAVASMRAR